MRFSAPLVFAVLFVSGCSGGSSPDGPGVPLPAPSATPASSNVASVTFKIKWPSAASAAVKVPHYLPATARSASIAVSGGHTQYINSPTATLTFTAPVGLDTFLVQTYDEQNGKGNVLSSANITQQISTTSANVVGATLNGTVAALNLVLSTYTTPAGTPRDVAVAVYGLDADGNTIVGPADYDRPITLSISDPANSGTLSLSKKLFQTPGIGSTATLAYNGGSLVSAAIVASANGVPSVSATFAPTPTFYQYAYSSDNNFPLYITAGPDGNMWFTDAGLSTIVRITPTGTMTSFQTPTEEAYPRDIIAASDGRLWFTETFGTNIGAVTTSGTFTEYPTNTGEPVFLVDRGDGNIWYTDGGDSGTLQPASIGIQPLSGAAASSLSFTLLGSNTSPYGIAVAPSGLVYFTYGDDIGYVTRDDSIYEVALPTADNGASQMVTGPDGNLWFIVPSASIIGAFNPQSRKVIAQYTIPSAGASPYGIVAGKDGALWFTENALNRIGRVTTSGTFTEYQIPGFAPGHPNGIGVARDGSLWICEVGAIIRFVY